MGKGISIPSDERAAEYLRGISLFSSLDDTDLRLIAKNVEWLQVKPGELLIKEGDCGTSVFCLVRGKLEVLRTDAAGKETVINTIRTGEVTGEMVLFDKRRRTASVRAVDESILVSLTAENLQQLADTHPSIMKVIGRLMADRLVTTPAGGGTASGVTIPVSLNLSVRGLGHSATLVINERSRFLQAQGRRIYRFGLGQSPFPVPEPVVSRLADYASEKDYLAVEGLPLLREAVADFHRRNDGAEVGAEDVLVGPGSKELMFLLQLAYYGDLLIPSPCWVSYGPQARIIGRKVKLLNTSFEEKWRLSPERFEALCNYDKMRPRVLILNYPGNPEGASYLRQELEHVAEVARKNAVIVLSDEIYGPLHHDGEHISIAQYYPEGTIISGGLSKWVGAGGWRLGTFTFPPQLSWLREAIASVASETYTSVCTPVQHAAVAAFQGSPEIDVYLVQSRRILKALGQYCVANLREVGIRVHLPVGGFYLLLDFHELRKSLRAKGIQGSLDLTARLLEEANVALLAGAHFERPEEEFTARLAYVDFDGAAALQACATIPVDQDLDESFLSTHCNRVVEGIQALAEWTRRLG